MADDEVGLRRTGGGVIGGGGQRQQHALLAQGLRDGDDLGAGGDEALRGAAEQPAHRAEAAGARDEDALADLAARLRPREGDAADGFIAGHQRVAHAGKHRHAAGPEQAFGAGADAAPLHVDDDIRVAGRGQLEAAEQEVLGFLEQDCDGFHDIRPPLSGLLSP